MMVTIYGMPGCQICGRLRGLLEKRGCVVKAASLEGALEVHDGWRNDGSVEIAATWAFRHGIYPVIALPDGFVDGRSMLNQLLQESLDNNSVAQ